MNKYETTLIVSFEKRIDELYSAYESHDLDEKLLVLTGGISVDDLKETFDKSTKKSIRQNYLSGAIIVVIFIFVMLATRNVDHLKSIIYIKILSSVLVGTVIAFLFEQNSRFGFNKWNESRVIKEIIRSKKTILNASELHHVMKFLTCYSLFENQEPSAIHFLNEELLDLMNSKIRIIDKISEKKINLN